MLTFAPDVLVADVEERTDAPPRPRRTTEDLTLQTHHGSDGAWHRKAIGGLVTACGLPIVRGSAMRLEAYNEPLCRRGCFTQFELEKAFQKKDEEHGR